MPKLLSRSKHEKFESNSTLQIRDQQERRAKNARKLKLQFGRLRNFATCKFSQVAKLQPADTVHISTVHHAAHVLLHFTHLLFLLQFFVSSYFNPCNSFCFGLFCNFPYTEHLYKPQSVQTLHQSTHFTSLRQYSEREAVSPLLPPFPIFFHFLSSFSAAKHSSEDDNSEDGL